MMQVEIIELEIQFQPVAAARNRRLGDFILRNRQYTTNTYHSTTATYLALLFRLTKTPCNHFRQPLLRLTTTYDSIFSFFNP